jgi:hypothetical protein
MQEFVGDWKISKPFTLDVANAMPAEFYNFKRNPEEMTFGEQTVHIAVANAFRFHEITGIDPPFPYDPSKDFPTDKASATKMLEQSFDCVIAILPQITPDELKHTWHIPSWKGRSDPDGRNARSTCASRALSRPTIPFSGARYSGLRSETLCQTVGPL